MIVRLISFVLSLVSPAKWWKTRMMLTEQIATEMEDGEYEYTVQDP